MSPRRVASLAFLALGAALLAQGLWIPAKAELAQHLLNRAWSATRDGGRNVRPWPWADTWPVARLRLPGAGEPIVVLAGASGRTLAFAPALLDGSAPLGAPGVAVIAAHRDTHFRGLASLALGDRFEIERPDGAVYSYDVAAIDVIDTARDQLDMNADESVVALVTCWPLDAVTPGGNERYVVTGRLKASAPDAVSATVKPTARKLSPSSPEDGGHMDIIYAAEKRSIAELLGNYVSEDVRPEEINVVENPSETGSFHIGWRLNRYVLSPAGEIAPGTASTS